MTGYSLVERQFFHFFITVPVSLLTVPSSVTTSMFIDFCRSLPMPILPIFFPTMVPVLMFCLLHVRVKGFSFLSEYTSQVLLTSGFALLPCSLGSTCLVPQCGKVVIPPGFLHTLLLISIPTINLHLFQFTAHFVLNNFDEFSTLSRYPDLID